MTTPEPNVTVNARAFLQGAQAILSESKTVLAEFRKCVSEFNATSRTILQELHAWRRSPSDASGSQRTEHHVAETRQSLLDFAINEEETQQSPSVSLESTSQHQGWTKVHALPPGYEDLVQLETPDLLSDGLSDGQAYTSSTEDLNSEKAPTGRHFTLERDAVSPRKYTISELLTYRLPAGHVDRTAWESMLKDVCDTSAITPRQTPKIRWALKFPFTDRGLRRGDSYLIPQLLGINLIEKLVEGHWEIARTIVICSTQRMTECAIETLEKIVSEITSRPPEANLGNGVAVVCDIVLKKQISRASTDFISRQKPVMVCSPSYAADFLAADVTQVLWLNLRLEGMVDLLQAFEACEESLIKSLRVTVVFDKSDKQQAWTIKTFLEETEAQVVTDLKAVDRHFPTRCMKMHCPAKLSTSDVSKVRAGRLQTESSHRRPVGVSNACSGD